MLLRFYDNKPSIKEENMGARTFFMLLVMVSFSFLLAGEVNAVPQPLIDCATGGCQFSISSPEVICDHQTRIEGQVANDPSYNYPYGLIGFEVGRCPESAGSIPTGITTEGSLTTTVELCFVDAQQNPIDMTGFIYRKYGPTPDNNTPHWYDFMYDGQTGAVINGNCITLNFVDGQRGDDDLLANGLIVDQGGPGQRQSAVPTMTQWGMGIVALLIGLTALLYLKRQRKTKE
jgi:hypothetical protein